MAYTTINKSSLHMNTKTFTGNGGTQSITGVGFQPDWTWLKKRNGTANHHVVDAVRGVGYYLYPNLTNAQGGNGSALLTSFNTDGFTLDAGADSNASGATGVSWNWKANGTGSANTAGSINSTVSVNTTAGFSIVKYTGTGSAGATVGHGLGVKPAMIIFKSLSVAGPSWVVYHQSKGATYTLYLDQTSAGGTSAEMLNNTEPTSSLITLGNGTSSNSSGASTIAYCFAEKQGYSKFGSYVGNANTNGTFCYTGFSPSFVIVKNVSGSESWHLWDNKRSPFNMRELVLYPNGSSVEEDVGADIDMLSNGFKLRSASTSVNGSGNSFIYMAFGQSLVGSNNVPNNAR